MCLQGPSVSAGSPPPSGRRRAGVLAMGSPAGAEGACGTGGTGGLPEPAAGIANVCAGALTDRGRHMSWPEIQELTLQELDEVVTWPSKEVANFKEMCFLVKMLKVLTDKGPWAQVVVSSGPLLGAPPCRKSFPAHWQVVASPPAAGEAAGPELASLKAAGGEKPPKKVTFNLGVEAGVDVAEAALAVDLVELNKEAEAEARAKASYAVAEHKVQAAGIKAGRSPEACRGLGLALNWLVKEDGSDEAHGAAMCLNYIGRVLSGGHCPPQAVVDTKWAQIKVRDALVLRCRCQAAPGDREEFLQFAARAFNGYLETELKARLLLAYSKVMEEEPDKFPSNNEIATKRRGAPRPRRAGRARKVHVQHNVTEIFNLGAEAGEEAFNLGLRAGDGPEAFTLGDFPIDDNLMPEYDARVASAAQRSRRVRAPAAGTIGPLQPQKVFLPEGRYNQGYNQDAGASSSSSP